jgi:hypothetical protein
MSDPLSAAERAAFAAYGALPDQATAGRLKDALAAHTATLRAAGVLREEGTATPADLELAARLLAEEADKSGFPRYRGEQWRMLLGSLPDVEVAFGWASRGVAPGDESAARDLAWARRVLRAAVSSSPPEDQQGGGSR